MDQVATTDRVWIQRLMALERWGLIATVAAVALFVAPQAKEAFRFPKELLFHALVFVVIALHALVWIARAPRRLTREQRIVAGALATILLWTTVTTVTTTNPVLSWFALLHVVLCVIFFWLVFQAATRETAQWELPLLLMILAVVNALTAILQKHELWTPFRLANLGRRETVVGFVGNPNDLGGFLVPCALVFMGSFFITRGRWRWANLFALTVCTYAIAVAESTTAIVSLLLGAVVLLVRSFGLRSKARRPGIALLLLAILILVPFLFFEQGHLQDKLRRMVRNDATEVLDTRLLAWNAASFLATQHPMLGTGPGTFSWHYMQTIATLRPVTSLPQPEGPDQVFGEVHNDFLEVAAETGFPGLGVALMAFFAFFRLTGGPRPVGDDLRSALVHSTAWPLALSLLVQMAVNFPLQITAVTVIYLYIGAHFLAWRSGALR